MAQLAATSTVSGLSREEVIEKCSELDFAALGRAYIDSTRPTTGQTPHFIDKLPFNYLYVGMIHRALPNAKIVNLQRHPMATCYAIYKQLFRDPYPFSYDLDDLGRYFIAYSGLMDHWNHVLPGVVHTVAYENLVDDTETQARALLEYCGLDWQEQCLTFYENRQAATTASAVQVRKPIYRSSLERWRDYAEGLASLDARLSDAGIDTS